MMCDDCGLRPASIRFTTIVGGEKKEENLCAACMAKRKPSLPNLDISGLAGLLSGFFQASKAAKAGGGEAEGEIDITCPRCQMTYETFRRTGLLGCSDCYESFREPLEKLIASIHGATQHTGRVPGGEARQATMRVTIDKMKERLVKAIAAEEYEEAAKLRDQIRALNSQMQLETEGGSGEQ